ncbi:MAG: hypothetical protein RL112_3012 [Planctomycetota bacterium]
MSVQDWWQENKRFASATAGGGIAFLIAWMLIQSFYGDELARAQRSASLTARKLSSESLYGREAEAAAQSRNDALAASARQLSDAVHFQTRPFWRLEPARGSAASQYFAVVAATREELLQRAGRAGLRLPEDLGLPALSPTREGDIERHLQALDLVDRVARTAMGRGVARIDRLEIRLDPRLNSKDGVGRVEKTRLFCALSGAPGALVDFVAATQDPTVEGGSPLVVEKVELAPSRGKSEEGSLEIVFLAARVERVGTE